MKQVKAEPRYGVKTDGGSLILLLPYPPSVNHYWMSRGNKRFISEAGQRFRSNVFNIVVLSGVLQKVAFNFDQQIELVVKVFPPDARKRDLDNILKGLFDSLQHAGVYADDSQIGAFAVMRQAAMFDGGAVLVQVSAGGTIHPYVQGECFLPAKAQEN